MEWFPETPGGVNRVYHGLVQHLPGAGVEVVGLVTGSEAVFRASAGRIRSVCPTGAPLLVRSWRWRQSIRGALSEDPTMLPAIHFAFYAFTALDRLVDNPMIVHFHGPWGQESRDEGAGRIVAGAKAALERTVYRCGAAFIVLSQAFGRILVETFAVPADRIHVIPGGVDVASFAVPISRAEARRSLGWSGDRPTFLAVRRLVRRMGLEHLIDAAALVRRRVPDAIILIGGTGPLCAELEARIRAADLQDTVRLLGRVPDEMLPIAYRAADLTVVPTTTLEGFGMVVPESLAAGTPVLVSPVGGLPEAVARLAPDLVLPATGPAPLADAIVQFQQGRLRIPGESDCRSYAEEHYDWPVVAARTAAVYREYAR
jgi:glycosyltransferase involved in cell wall biosynthesis